MIVTFWLDGEEVRIADIGTHPPPGVGDCAFVRSDLAQYVVSERWLNLPGGHYAREGWHIVLRRPETPAESTPPWKRKEEG